MASRFRATVWIDCTRRTGGTTGTDRVAALVAPRLGARLVADSVRVVVAVTRTDVALGRELRDAGVVVVPVPAFNMARRRGRLIHAALVAAREALRPDVVLSFHNLAASSFARGAIVTTLHDVIPLELGPPYLAPGTIEEHRALLKRNAERASAIVAVSEAAHRSAIAHLGALTARVFVAPNSSALAKPIGGGSRPCENPYVLVHGGGEPRKEVATAVRAWTALAPAVRDGYRLAIIGGAWHGFSVPNGPDVLALGHVVDSLYPAIVAGATVCLCPSRAEGFDLPLLDAMRFGIPTVASDIAAHREVGGNAPEYFRSGDAGALTRALERALAWTKTERAVIIAAGREQAASFTNERTVNGYFEAIQHALRRSLEH